MACPLAYPMYSVISLSPQCWTSFQQPELLTQTKVLVFVVLHMTIPIGSLMKPFYNNNTKDIKLSVLVLHKKFFGELFITTKKKYNGTRISCAVRDE